MSPVLATGRPGAKVPFKRMTEDSDAFMHSIFLPDNVVFKDPSSYRAEDIHDILSLWRQRQKQGVIPFQFKSILVGKDVRLAEYPEGLFEGWRPPTTNVKLKTVRSSEPSAAPANSATLPDIQELDEDDSFDNSRLPNAAQSQDSESEQETTISGPSLTERTDHLLSPPPTDLSEATDTPPQQPHRHKGKVIISEDDETPEPTLPCSDEIASATPPNRRRTQVKRYNAKVVISEDEHTPEPTLPQPEAFDTSTPPTICQGRPKLTPEVLLTRRRPRQLETPGPSDSATPATSDAGTPDNTPAPELRKSTRIRRARSRFA